MTRRAPTKPGLQSERTQLSWERTALGFLLGGVLALLREHGPLGPGRALLAATAAVLALLVLVLGHRRGKASHDGHAIAAGSAEVVVLGVATAAFAVAVIGALVYSLGW
ncbi:DUF202 domain-containing protein [Mycobacterium sp. pV006]|uniref:DUF202 domain-containing protein n=1 Tax=Mycobacterium sp. pV006 TaxID=3238983 RepID=UPI00351B9BCC